MRTVDTLNQAITDARDAAVKQVTQLRQEIAWAMDADVIDTAHIAQKTHAACCQTGIATHLSTVLPLRPPLDIQIEWLEDKVRDWSEQGALLVRNDGTVPAESHALFAAARALKPLID